MATVTPGVTIPVGGAYATPTPYSGAFIPTLWSSKLNSKFYQASTFADIANTNWQGDLSGIGDKVIINNIPDIAISKYVPGAGLTYQVPTPSTIEMQIDQGRYFAFQVNDLLDMQSKPNLMDTFSNDASMQMKVAIDSDCFYRTFLNGAAANKGATAGAKSGGYNLGTEAAPVQITAGSSLNIITAMAAVLDEQNIPETDRFIIIDPQTRIDLMKSNLAQAQFMGDSQSMVRNGKIGSIDRFTTYVSNNLPKMNASGTTWISGDGSDSSLTGTTYTSKRRTVIAGHKSAISFASQMTKMETVRNPHDFGDYVRGVNVYGVKVVKPEALAVAVVY